MNLMEFDADPRRSRLSHAHRRTRHGIALWLGGAALVLGVTGCAGMRNAPRPLPDDVTAIWVTRSDYRTPDDVTRIIQNCADAGFNTVVFQVRGNGTAYYKSHYEPWDKAFDWKDPGWDPLDLAIREAHARGMTLHAWVNVMPAWRGKTPPENPEQLYNKRPEWFWYDQHGQRQALSTFYVSLNPCLPEVRTYLVDVFRDIAARYDIDGLHMDYIRFPNEPPARPRGSDIDYPHDERTLALYREATGKSPADDKDAWNQWRTDCVTQLVADISAMLRSVRRGAQLTASVGSVPRNALSHMQDGQRWLRDGHVDAVFLMNYTPTVEEFTKRIDNWRRTAVPEKGDAAGGDLPVIPGLSIGSHARKPPPEGARDAAAQIAAAREKTGDVCVFAYSYLFDSADQGDLVSDASEKASNDREIRRAILFPVLRREPAAVQ